MKVSLRMSLLSRPISLAALVLTSSVAALASCAMPAGPMLIDEPLGDFPSALSGLGLYPSGGIDQVDERAFEYAPTHELWSNGSQKFRYLVLPAGTKIAADDAEEWTFPSGTLIFKTFAYPRADGSLRPVETRVMRLTASGKWEFASYRWTSDRGGIRAELEVAELVSVDAFGETFDHAIPSLRQCRQCHEAGSRRTLGLNDRSMVDVIDGSSELERLIAAGWVDLGGREPTSIPESDPQERAVIAYVWANCTHCHNGEALPSASFDLAPEVFLANTINRRTESEAASAGVRIIPGDPDGSVIVGAMLDDDDARAMPPIGVQRRDAAAIEQISQWIAGLE